MEGDAYQATGHGVSEAVVKKHQDFVEGFLKGVETIQRKNGKV